MSTNINFDKKLGLKGGTGITLPTSSTPSFQNLNSFLFDGIDEKMFSTSNYTELNGTQNFSISFWIKPIDINAGIVWRLGSQSGSNRLACLWRDNGSVDISFNTSSYYYRTNAGSVPLNQWTHIVYTYDGTQTSANRPDIYINGVNANGTTTGVNVTSSAFNGTLELGGTGTSGTINFGNNYIEEFSVWNNTTLTESQANELYNGGTPTDLNNIASGLTQPTTWFRMGDVASWNGATWTMTDVNGGTVVRSANMQESSRTTDVPTIPFSTRSIALDGVDDYVEVADADNLSFGNGTTDSPFSISTWVNMTDATNFRIVNKYDSNFEYLFSTGGADTIVFLLYDNSAGSRIGRLYSTALTSFQGSWIHLVATYSGNGSSTGLKIYLNGSRVDNTDNNSGSYTAMENTTAPLEIGKVTTTNASGLIDETAIFNSELSQGDVTTIYNGGVPNDISSLSPISWWRCGDGDTAPILIDNGSGGNNGTMTNFTTFSTDVPT